MARPRIILLALSALAACASPSPPLLSATRTVVTSDEAEWVVRHTDRRAEAVRVSAHSGPGLMASLAEAKAAIEAASGCRVRAGTLYGDRVMAEAWLDCPATQPPLLQPVLTGPAVP